MATDQNSPVTSYTASPASHTTTTAEFPDGAPPPQNQPGYLVNVSANSDRNIYQDWANCICSTVILPAIIIIGIIALIALLPGSQDPHQFRIDTLTLSNFNISSNSTSMINSGTIWDARFTVTNPNSKIVLYYDCVDAYIFYHSKLISGTAVPPFMQGKNNETTVSALFVSQPVYQHVDYGNGTNREKAPGIFDFDLLMSASVRFSPSYWPLDTGRRYLEIDCFNLPVRVSTDSNAGSLVGGSKHCRVRS